MAAWMRAIMRDERAWDDWLPSQWGHDVPWTGEQRLCARLLEYAVAEALGRGIVAGGRCGPRARVRAQQQAQAARWIAASETGPFSFLGVCGVLSLAPERIRRYVRAAQAAQREEAA